MKSEIIDRIEKAGKNYQKNFNEQNLTNKDISILNELLLCNFIKGYYEGIKHKDSKWIEIVINNRDKLSFTKFFKSRRKYIKKIDQKHREKYIKFSQKFFNEMQ